MKMMNQFLETCDPETEGDFSPEDVEVMRALEAEYEEQKEPFSPEDEEILHELDQEYRAQEKVQRQKQRERVSFGRWNQLLIRIAAVLITLFIVTCVWHRCSIRNVLWIWLVSELVWCGVREFYRIGDLVLHELAVVSGILLFAMMQSPEKMLYVYGLSCMAAVLISNKLGLRMWQGKTLKYNENIARLFCVLCTALSVVFCYYH